MMFAFSAVQVGLFFFLSALFGAVAHVIASGVQRSRIVVIKTRAWPTRSSQFDNGRHARQEASRWN